MKIEYLWLLNAFIVSRTQESEIANFEPENDGEMTRVEYLAGSSLCTPNMAILEGEKELSQFQSKLEFYRTSCEEIIKKYANYE